MVRADLETDAAALLRPEWLAGRRWFGARDRTITGVHLADAAPLRAASDGAPPAWLLVAEATFADGGRSRYLLPAVGAAGAELREPEDGDGAWAALAAAIEDGATLPGEAGSFRSETLPAMTALLPAGSASRLAERRLGVEQSNTSVALGDGLILKLYRRLEPGENPELEIGTFLESVGCSVAPRMAGAIRYLAEDGSASAAVMLQERVAATADGWHTLLGLLRGADGGPEAAIAEVAAVGAATATLHVALAARPLDLAFPARDATGAEVAGWGGAARDQLEGAIGALGGDERARLQALAPAVRERLRAALADAAPARARAMRIHGDLHLGQVLRTDRGYVVIDFEGEPARPLAERRAPQPPERDVAGMLRSLDYAARTVERELGPDRLDAAGWLAAAREAFLAAYAAAAPSAPQPGLLLAFELEKACYEVRYEAANRPDWTWLPLDALARMA